MIISLFSMLFGFGKEIVLSYFYGASSITDAYILSQEIPMFLMGIIGSSIYTTYIPIASKLYNESINKLNSFTRNVFVFILIASFTILLLNNIFIDFFIRLFAYNFSDSSISLTKNMLRVTFFSGFFYFSVQIIVAYLRINNVFYVTQLSSILPKIVLIVTIILSKFYGIFFLPLGILLSIIVQFIILLFFSRKFLSFSETFSYSFNDNIRQLVINALPLLISGLFLQANTLVDVTLSTRFGEGSISIISYASRVNNLILTVFLTPIIAVFYPEISKLIAINNQIELTKTINKNIMFSLYLIVPSSIGILILSEDIIGLIYGRGNFTDQDILETSLVLSAYSFTLISNVFTTIIGNIFFSNKDTRTPLFIGGFTLLINVFLSFVLSNTYGLVGLPIATTVTSIVAVILYWVFAKKMNYFVESTDFFIEIFKIVISSISMAGVILGLRILVEADLWLLSIPLGAIVYFVSTIFLKTKLVSDFKKKN